MCMHYLFTSYKLNRKYYPIVIYKNILYENNKKILYFLSINSINCVVIDILYIVKCITTHFK